MNNIRTPLVILGVKAAANEVKCEQADFTEHWGLINHLDMELQTLFWVTVLARPEFTPLPAWIEGYLPTLEEL